MRKKANLFINQHDFMLNMTEDINKEIQRKYLELQLVDKQIKQLQQQLQIVETQIIELTALVQGLDEFNNIKSGTEILVPIGSGIFAKASLKDNNTFLVNVGSNVVVKKDLNGVKGMLRVQLEELNKLKNQLASELNSMTAQLQEIERSAEAMLSKQKAE